MKQLVCEMCGSTDLLKDGGVFVCQSCGCKYTVEEAKKMMVEGVVEVQGNVSIDNTVDVQGTVQVDNTAYVERYLANARRAKEKQDWEEVEKYYNMVEQNDPDNIEAIFYSAYAKARQSLLDGDMYKREAAFKVLQNCISVIDDHYQISRGDENREVIVGMAKDLIGIMTCNFANRANTKASTSVLFAGLIRGFTESIRNIARIDDHAYLHQCLIAVWESAVHIEWPTISSAVEIGKTIYQVKLAEQETLDMLIKRSTEVWFSTHAADYELAIKERDDNAARIDELRHSIDVLPESTLLTSLKEEESSLKTKLAGLGLFKGKEKAAIRTQLSELAERIKQAEEAKNKAASDIEKEIEQCESKAVAIAQILSSPMPEMPGDMYAEFSALQQKYRSEYFEANPDQQAKFEEAQASVEAAQKTLRLAEKELADSKLESDKKKARSKIDTAREHLNETEAVRSAILYEVDAKLRSDEYVQTVLSQYGKTES